MYNKVPDYNHLKKFGCQYFASTLVANRHKFDPRVMKWVLLSYPLGTRGYRLLDLNTGKVFNSRDVKFWTYFLYSDKVATHKFINESITNYQQSLSQDEAVTHTPISATNDQMTSGHEDHSELAEEIVDMTHNHNEQPQLA